MTIQSYNSIHIPTTTEVLVEEERELLVQRSQRHQYGQDNHHNSIDDDSTLLSTTRTVSSSWWKNHPITSSGGGTLMVVVGVLLAAVVAMTSMFGNFHPNSSSSWTLHLSSSEVAEDASSSMIAANLLGKGHTPSSSSPLPPPPPPTTTGSSSSSTLSQRGQDLKPARDDLAAFMIAAADPYDPIGNRDGYLVMLVAENKLMYKELSQQLEEVTTTTTTTSFIPEWVFDYGDMRGQFNFRKAIATMMERSWISAPVHPDQLVIQSGAGAILDSLSWILADDGDALLLTSPAYPAFASDFAIHGKMVVYYAPTTAEQNYEPTIQELDTAYNNAVTDGHIPKIFVICQPNNPVGVIYSETSMELMINWALSKEPIMHIVSDEIYGNSIFPGTHVTSAAEIMWNQNNNKVVMEEDKEEEEQTTIPSMNQTYLGDHVHVVAGLSKDWGMSGFRVGSLLTHNQELIMAMGMLSYYNSVSQYTQYAITKVLEDTHWVDWYFEENKRRLESVYVACTHALSRIGVPVFPNTKGALFVWADFSSFLQDGQQTEHELWLELFEVVRILFTTGESCHGEKPGMFRVVYPWPEGGVLAMQELGDRLVQWKAQREKDKAR